jgi:hypothetical protein
MILNVYFQLSLFTQYSQKQDGLTLKIYCGLLYIDISPDFTLIKLN